MKASRRSLITHLFVALFCLSAIGCSSTGSGDGTQNGLSEADLAAQQNARYRDGAIPLAEGEGMFKDIRFAYDSAEISDESRMNIERNAKILEQNPTLRFVLEGHTDERGTNEYNLALGDHRARSVKQALIALGISTSRIDTISYGEELPLDQSHSEAAYAANRRVHFSPAQ